MYEAMQINRYQATDIHSVGPEKLLVLVYEKLVSHLETARTALQKGNSASMIQSVNAAQRIIMELRNSLDHEIGGEVTLNLESLYDFMFQENLALLVDHQSQHLNYLDRVVRPLLTAWRQIPAGSAEKAREELQPTTTAAYPPPGPPSPGMSATGNNPAQAPGGSFSLAV